MLPGRTVASTLACAALLAAAACAGESVAAPPSSHHAPPARSLGGAFARVAHEASAAQAPPNVMTGGPGPDAIHGTPGPDAIDPGSGRDRVWGEAGDDVIDTVDGEPDEVWCGPGRDAVTADAVDRVWGDCELLNGRAWQVDRRLGATSDQRSLGAMAGVGAWIDGGTLTLWHGGRLSRRVWPGRGRHMSGLDLGVDAKGRRVVVTRLSCRGSSACGRWVLVDLATRRMHTLALRLPAGCAATSVAVWRRSTAVGARCRTDQRVLLASGRGLLRVLLCVPATPAPFGGPLVDVEGDRVVAGAGGATWLLDGGRSPCAARRLDEALAGQPMATPGPPRLAQGRVVWPSASARAGGPALVTVAVPGPRCSVSRRYAIVSHPASVATIVGSRLLTVVAGAVRDRALETVPPPLEPAPGPPVIGAAVPGAPRASAYARAVLGDDGALSLWRLGDTGSAVAYDGRRAHDGAYAGGAAAGAPGAIVGDPDTAAALGGGQQRVTVPDDPALTPSGAFTQEAWFRLDPQAADASDHLIVSKSQWPNGYLLAVLSDGRLADSVMGAAGALGVSTAGPVVPGVWHHAAAVFDGRTLALYLDGGAVASSSQQDPFGATAVKAPLTIGAGADGGGAFVGSIDEVALYASALSPTAIARHYAIGDGRPGVQTGSPTATGATSEDLGADVEPGGRATTYHFDFGPTPSYGQATPEQGAGAGTSYGPVSGSLTGLVAGSTYHYRVVATSVAGSRAGADQTFVAGRYANPVSARDFPDPSVIRTETGYYAYSTNRYFPVMHSRDLVNWTDAGTAFTGTSPPPWAGAPQWVTGDWFGPSVVELHTTTTRSCPGFDLPLGAPCFYLYYTGLSSSSVHCVGVATSNRPDGGFVDRGILQADGAETSAGSGSRAPGCGDAHGYGYVDPDVYVDPSTGRGYLYFTTEYTCGAGCWMNRTLSVLPLSDDLVHAGAARVALFAATQPWEQGVVEGPTLVPHGGRLWLLYSAADWRAASYGMGAAVGDSPLGPFTKLVGNPILASGNGVDGPGGGTVVSGPLTGDDELVYHGRSAPGANPRQLRVDRLVWDDGNGSVSVAGPTTGEQALP